MMGLPVVDSAALLVNTILPLIEVPPVGEKLDLPAIILSLAEKLGPLVLALVYESTVCLVDRGLVWKTLVSLIEAPLLRVKDVAVPVEKPPRPLDSKVSVSRADVVLVENTIVEEMGAGLVDEEPV
jgi:hypothetical protein